jgi:hypothetical protein
MFHQLVRDGAILLLEHGFSGNLSGIKIIPATETEIKAYCTPSYPKTHQVTME